MTLSGDLIGTEELEQLADDSAVRIVDTRFDLFEPSKGREDYLAGHIPGAVYADLDRDLSSEITPNSGRHPLPDPETFRATVERWGISDDTPVVVYDGGNGAVAVRLWWMLKMWFGHPQVAVLDGGFAAWNDADGVSETAVPEYVSGTFSRSPDISVVATTNEIVDSIESARSLNLVDAREAPRFLGEVEPIDTVAGRIPGARNMPLSGNVNADGTWRSTAELAAAWEPFRSADGDELPVVMCGSGVTACHLALSAHLTGMPVPRLYVGSWSEWIRDPDRPVATGP